MAPLHDRMPLIIEPRDFERWLDCRSGSTEHILDLLRPFADDCLATTAVNPALNDPRVDGPELHTPVFSNLLL